MIKPLSFLTLSSTIILRDLVDLNLVVKLGLQEKMDKLWFCHAIG